MLQFIINVDRFFVFRCLPIALAAMKQGYEVHVATVGTEHLDELERHGFIVPH